MSSSLLFCHRLGVVSVKQAHGGGFPLIIVGVRNM